MFRDDMILCTYPKEYTNTHVCVHTHTLTANSEIQQSCRVQNQHTKISSYAISTNNEQFKRRLRKQLHFTTLKRIKYLGIN